MNEYSIFTIFRVTLSYLHLSFFANQMGPNSINKYLLLINEYVIFIIFRRNAVQLFKAPTTHTTMTPLPVLDGERVTLRPKEQVVPSFFDKRTKNRDRRGYVIAIFLCINLALLSPVLYIYIYILYYIYI